MAPRSAFDRRFGRTAIALAAAVMVVTGQQSGAVVNARAASNYSAVVLADSPAAYWRLGDSTGTVLSESSGHNYPAVLIGSATLSTPGALTADADAAVAFSGGAGRLGLSPISAPSNWTLEAWVNPAQLPQAAVIEYAGGSGNAQDGFGIGIGNGTGGAGSNLVGVLGSAGTVDSGYTFGAANLWYHVVATRDSSTITFYVNGARTSRTSAVVPPSPSSAFSFGGASNYQGAISQSFRGSLDEVAAYNTPLASGRIGAHFSEATRAVSGFGNWAQQTPASSPPARTAPGMAFDAARNQVVLFGGLSAAGAPLADTWTWNGSTWSQQNVTPSPPARWGESLVYDAQTSSTLLFGGQSSSATFLNDTWSWNGSAWTKLTPATSPSPRSGAAAGYRAANSTVLVFGGQTATSTYAADTYSWNGTTWTQLAPATSPPARAFASASNHDSSQTIVVFGGQATSGLLSDTWTWNGTTWAAASVSASPAPRYAASAAYSPLTSAVVLSGGTRDGATSLPDTWAWDGQSWSQQAPSVVPGSRYGSGMAYDAATATITAFGGNSGAVAYGDTWTWLTPPGTPAGLTATPGNGQVTVTWAAPPTGGSPMTGYVIIPFMGSAQAPLSAGPSATSILVTGLSNGSSYTFSVQARNAIGLSAQATSQAAVPMTVPDNPSSVSATPGNAQATVSWGTPFDEGRPITGYSVTPYIGSTAQTTINTGVVNSTMVTGLTNGTTYTFRVAAVNSLGTSSQSASNAVTPATIPAAPTNVKVTPYHQSAIVTWTAPASGGSSITQYTVTPFIGTTPQTLTAVAGSSTRAIVGGLANGTSYTFQVSAGNSAGAGPVGTSAAAVPKAVPSAPTTVNGSQTSTTAATVTWTAATPNSGSITGYVVTPYKGSTAGTAVNLGASARSAVVTSLTSGSTYTFQVYATNATGNGMPGTSNTVLLSSSVPGAPTALQATAGANQATLSWTAPAANGSAITTYQVTAFQAGNPQNSVALIAPASSTVMTGLVSGLPYTFTVTAYNSSGSGPPSSASAAVTPTGAAGANYPSSVIGLAPSIYLRLDDTSASVVADSSGNARNATFKNGHSTATGALGSESDAAVGFNNGYVQYGASTGLPLGNQARTIELWARNGNALVSYGTGGTTSNQEFAVSISGQQIQVSAGKDTLSFPAPYDPIGGWHYISVTYDGLTTITAYVDGASVGSGSLSTKLSTLYSSAGLQVGRRGSCSCGNGYGSIDELALYPVALSGAQVTSNFAASGNRVPGSPSNVVATPGANQAVVSWTAASAPSGSPVTSYVVTAYQGTTAGLAKAVDGGSTSATLTGLAGAVTYTFKVVALNRLGGSAAAASGGVTVTGTASTYASTVLAGGPALYYRLGDSSTTRAADSSGSGRHAYYGYGVTGTGPGAIVGDADTAAVTQSSGPIIYPFAAGLPTGHSARTVEGWFTSGGSQSYGSYGTEFNVNYGSTYISARINGATVQLSVPGARNNTNWHHAVLTYDGGVTVTGYLDGANIGSATLPSLPTTDTLAGYQIYVSGSADEAALYPRALSSAEVVSHFQASGNFAPAAPTSVTATAAANQATVAWTAGTVPAGAPVNYYIVQAYNGAVATTSVVSTGTTATVTGLVSGSAYTFKVSGTSDFGRGPWSAASNTTTPSGSTTTYAATVQADAPAAYYRFNDGGNIAAADSSGNLRLGVYGNTSANPGAIPLDSDNTGMYVNGGPGFGYIGSGLPSGNQDRTIEVWINPDMTQQYGGAVSVGDISVSAPSPNQVGVVLGGTYQRLSTPYPIASDWHHVAVSYSGAALQARVYFDGSYLGAVSTPTALATTSNRIDTIWYGSIDELAVYSSTLSASRILAHFTASAHAAPGQPTVSAASAGANQATVTWAAPTTGGSPTGYLVSAYSSGKRAGAVAVDSTASTATVYGLPAAGAMYTLTVMAQGAFGSGPESVPSASVAPTGAATTYSSAVLGSTPAPAVYYRLGDGSRSQAADAIRSNHIAMGTRTSQAGMLTGFPDSSTAGTLQDFDGSGYPQTNSARSIELWFSGTAPGYVFGSAGNPTFNALVGSFTITLEIGADRPVFATPVSVLGGGWHQLVVSYDGGLTVTVDIDGASLGSQRLSSPAQGTMDGESLYIGSSRYAGCYQCPDPWFGSLEELAIYPGVLSQSTIVSHFNASGQQRPGPVTNVVATAGTKQATVSWQPATVTSGSSPVAYLVRAYAGSRALNAEYVPASSTTATIGGLNSGAAVTFVVTGYDQSGPGQDSTPSAAVTPTGDGVATYASVVQSSNPYTYLRLGDSGSYMAADSSGLGHQGAYVIPSGSSATITPTTPGAIVGDPDAAVHLNQFQFNATACVQYPSGVGAPTGQMPRSIEFWFNTNSFSNTWDVEFRFGPRANIFTGLGMNVDLLMSHKISTVAGDFTTPYVVTDGNWHQFVQSYDGTTASVFLDGTPLGSSTVSLPAGSASMQLGCGEPTVSLDEVAAYGQALTSTDVTNHWNASGNGRPGQPTGVSATAGPNQATVSWVLPAQPAGHAATGWLVQATASGTAVNAVTAAPNQSSIVMTGLSSGVTYAFTVTGINLFGKGQTSAPPVSAAPTGSASPTFAASVLADAPAAYYRLGDGGLPLADSSGHGGYGVLLGTAGSAGALASDADGAVTTGVNLPYGSGLADGAAPFSLEFWANGPATVNWWYGNGSRIQVADGSITVNTGTETRAFPLATPFLAPGFHHVAVTSDGSHTISAFFDGQPLPAQAQLGGSWYLAESGYGLTITTAALDEVATYPTALSAARVLAHFTNSGNAVPTAPAGVTATAGTNQATVSWNAVPSHPAPYAYMVRSFVGLQGQVATSVAGTTTTAVVSGLQAGQSYTFQVIALNSVGLGPLSAASAPLSVGGTTTTYASSVLAQTPALYYRLGDQSRVAADSSGHANDTQYAGGSATIVPGALASDSDPAQRFTAYTGLVYPGTALPTASTAPRTYEAWFQTTADMDLVEQRFPSNQWGWCVCGQTFTLSSYSTPAVTFPLPYAVEDGNWHHAALSYTGTSAALYLDGLLVANVTYSMPDVSGAGATVVAGVGTFGIPATIDEFALYPAALTLTQIRDHVAHAGRGPPPPTNVVARPGAYSVSLSWSPPVGTAAISGYTITTYKGAVGPGSATVVTQTTVAAATTSLIIPNLSSAIDYEFAVNAFNGTGVGAPANSALVRPLGSAVGGLGTSLYITNTGLDQMDQAYATMDFSTHTALPALSTQWTIEGYIWNVSNACFDGLGGSTLSWGVLQGSPGQASAAPPLAGISFGCTSTAQASYFVFPGGQGPTWGAQGLGSDAATPVHYALSWDGATVRGYVQGALVFSQADGNAGLPAAPVGLVDRTFIRTAQFANLRISNVARYTGSSFAPPLPATNDAQTVALYNFSDYAVSKLSAQTLSNLPNSGPATKPGVFGDGSSAGGADGGMDQHVGFTRDVMWAQKEHFNLFSLLADFLDPLSGIAGGSPIQLLAQCITESPVNTLTGEFWHSFCDLKVPGRGVGLDYSRTYSSQLASQAGRLGRLGFGWTDSYNQYAEITPGTGDVRVHFGNGSSVLFRKNGSVYTPAKAVTGALTLAGSTYTLTDKSQNRTLFDSTTGYLTAISDRTGEQTTLNYSGGLLQTAVDSSGRALTFTYAGGRLTQVSDVASRSVSYGYDANGNLSQVTNVDGGIWKYTYDSSHRMLTMQDPNCVAQPSRCTYTNTDGTFTGLANVYDTSSRVTTQYDDLGRKTTFNYQTASDPTTTVTDPSGNQTDHVYMNNLLLRVVKAKGTSQQSTSAFSYDPLSLGRVSATDANGDTSTSVLDSLGNVLSATDALGRTSTFSNYNSSSEPQQTTDAGGVVTSITYDQYGNVTQVSTPIDTSPGQNKVTKFTYDPTHHGDVVKLTDANNRDWAITYDAYGDLASVTNPAPFSNKTVYGYDAVGRATCLATPKSHLATCGASAYTTSYVPDAYGSATLEADPLGHQIHRTYDLNHNLTALTDGNNHTTRYTYDAAGQLTQTIRPDSTPQIPDILATGYDANGNVITQTDALNFTTTYHRDALNQVDWSTDPLGRRTTLQHDLAGNVISSLDPNGHTATMSYDTANQLTSVSYSDASTHAVSFGYTTNGQVSSMSDGTGVSSYAYDSLHRLTQSVDGSGARVGYGYDPLGDLTSITYPGGTNQVTRAYDEAGRLKAVTDWLTHQTSFAYDENSNLATESYPNGVVATYTVNAADQLSGITDTKAATTFLSFTYGRDGAGRVGSDGSTSYSFDAANRISAAGPTTFAVDLADRLSRVVIAGGNTTTLAYDLAHEHEVQSRTVTNGATQLSMLTFGYDANGNRTTVTDQTNATTTLTYDQSNRMTAYGSAGTYAYNGVGIRTQKTVTGVNSAQTWDLAEGLPVLVQDGSVQYVTGPGGLPLEQISSGVVRYFHADQIGSTRALTDTTGSVVGTSSFDAFGNTTAAGGVSTPFQYAGQYLDSESGLYFMRARHYDPGTGQFVSRDPALATTREPYAYVSGDPVNGSDPSGMIAPAAGAAIGAVVGAIVFGAADAYCQWRRNGNSFRNFDVTELAVVTGVGAVEGAIVGATLGLSAARSAASAAEETAIGLGTEEGGYSSFSAAKSGLGSPGEGNVYDHIVEQSQMGKSAFSSEQINNAENLNPVPSGLNQIKANYYNSIRPFSDGMRVRNWLAGQSFEAQWKFGMDVTEQIWNGEIR